jgi:hypothetical protein
VTPSDAIRRHPTPSEGVHLRGIVRALGRLEHAALGHHRTNQHSRCAQTEPVARERWLGDQRGQRAIRGGNQRAIRSQRAIEGTHAPSEVESIATPRAFVWRIRVRSSQVAGRLIRRHTLHRGYHVVIVATRVVIRDEEESLVPAGARTCHIRKAYAMSVQSSGNQRAMRRQSEGDEMVI